MLVGVRGQLEGVHNKKNLCVCVHARMHVNTHLLELIFLSWHYE